MVLDKGCGNFILSSLCVLEDVKGDFLFKTKIVVGEHNWEIPLPAP